MCQYPGGGDWSFPKVGSTRLESQTEGKDQNQTTKQLQDLETSLQQFLINTDEEHKPSHHGEAFLSRQEEAGSRPVEVNDDHQYVHVGKKLHEL